MTSLYRQYLRLLLGIVFMCICALSAFNLVLDPYASFRLFPQTRLARGAAGMETHIAKAEMLAGHDWDVLLLGTSRVEEGLDPMHPAFAGQRVYNAGLSGGDFPELDRAARLAIKRHPPRRIILCVDFFCFDPDWTTPPDAERSWLNPNLSATEYYAGHLLSVGTTKLSMATLTQAMHDRTGRDYPLGLYAPHISGAGESLEIWMDDGFLRLSLPPGVEKSDRWPLSEARFDALSALLDDTARAGIKIDVVQLPMHAACLEGYFAANRWPMYERWITTMTHLVADHNRRFPEAPVPFWNFCNYNVFAVDPATNKSPWFYDPFHFTVPLGNLALDRITGFPAPAGMDVPDFGIRMTEDNVVAHLAKLCADHRAYYASSPAVATIHRITRRSLADRASQDD